MLSKKDNPTPAELASYMDYNPEDGAFFNSFFSILPMSTMGSLGPHSVAAIREICQICNPHMILEIGFNVGYSSYMWLSFTDAEVYSVDNSTREHTLQAVPIIKKEFGHRFNFLNEDSAKVQHLLRDIHFDFGFVDGDHTAAGVLRDLSLVRSLGINTIAMDDYWPMFSAAQEVLPQSGYSVQRQWGNIVLCQLSTGKP